MSEIMILLSPDDPKASQAAREQLESGAGKILQSYGAGVVIVEAAPGFASTLKSHPGVVGIYQDEVPEDVTHDLDETAKMGVAAWNQRRQPSFNEAKRQRKGEGLSWGHPDFEREG